MIWPKLLFHKIKALGAITQKGVFPNNFAKREVGGEN